MAKRTKSGTPARTATRKAKPGVTLLRSRYREYRFGALEFHNHIAETSDEKVLAAARASPHFGVGLDFWEDTDTVVHPDDVAEN